MTDADAVGNLEPATTADGESKWSGVDCVCAGSTRSSSQKVKLLPQTCHCSRFGSKEPALASKATSTLAEPDFTFAGLTVESQSRVEDLLKLEVE